MEIPTPSIPIPSYVIKLLGSSQDVGDSALEFFDTIHTYLAIISKRRFYDHLLNPLLPRRADVAFLCLCMKLVLWKPSVVESIPNIEEYATAIKYLLELEAAGIFTLQVLQGRLLISLFELGHSIYPAAYMSISACAAHGLALGLDRSQVTGVAKNLSWVEMEERRRVWWAIVIVERFDIRLGSIFISY